MFEGLSSQSKRVVLLSERRDCGLWRGAQSFVRPCKVREDIRSRSAIGCYPEWGENHPVHLVGHSSGAQVARVLQQMLADKAFSGHNNTSADWILSITSISGALNGTTRVYMDGIRPEDGRTLKSVCLLQLCRVGVIIYEWLDIPVLKKYYSFGFDHYNLSWHKSGILGLAKTIAGQDGPFAKGDWILPDLSLQATITVNNHLKTHPNTYYISYGTKRTMKVLGKTIPSTIRGFHPILFIRALQMSFWKHPSDAAPPHAAYRDEDWHDNDGALNTISMLYPNFLPILHIALLNSSRMGSSLNQGSGFTEFFHLK